MIIEESDLFRGLNPEIINEIAESMIEEFYRKGSSIFKESYLAEHFYILEEGKIRLSVGEHGRITHLVSHPGESFGWSSLVGQESAYAYAVNEGQEADYAEGPQDEERKASARGPAEAADESAGRSQRDESPRDGQRP